MIIINSYAVQAAASDVTPNALAGSYEAYSEDNIGGSLSNNAVFQITGINTTITLKITFNGYGGTIYPYCQVSNDNSHADKLATSLTPPGQLSNNGTFTVTNGQYVTIGCWGFGFVTDTFYIYNSSDGDALLTQINATIDM